MADLQPLPAFDDNYVWCFTSTDGGLWLVDPGDTAVVHQVLAGDRPLRGVLITHHHRDHIDALPLLQDRAGIEIVTPDDPRIPIATRRVGEGELVRCGERVFTVIATPGHTRSHLSYCDGDLLFCGDTLFSLGCGRLFEGTPAQMLESLQRLAALPASVRVCCTHEYTEANLRFALHVDPDNPALQDHARWVNGRRRAGLPTLPSTLATELACNPFLRSGSNSVLASLRRERGDPGADPVERFAALRLWKDEFRA